MTTTQDRPAPPGIGAELRYGTYEEALTYVGRESAPVEGDVEVNWATIRHYCAAIHDGNPSYWDPEVAQQTWGGLVAPPAMLMSWTIELPWKPGDFTPAPLVMGDVPLPGSSIVNVSNDTTHERPLRVGEKVAARVRIESVSPQKTTRVGTGHFITTLTTFTVEDEVVATQENTLFRFDLAASENTETSTA
ncbi:hypothetical protein GCM10009836_01700 [Pseudonocardia ailaonensis]|uniref:FAS1-like dehydratase domain-containing protein n=1 Tax=Pseudonocardia ailaonensis TaxID=367279 RepID=A0ABN2MI33_9PSEU